MSSSKPRRGVPPTILSLPTGTDPVERIFQALSAKGASATREDIVQKMDAGDIGIINNSGAYIHRPVHDETDIDLPVVFENERIIIVDKPSGISTTPQGSYVARSVLVQARRKFGDDIICAHRLDRATSGVLLLVKEPHMRRAYQMMFADQVVDKTYEFIAPKKDDIPSTYSSRIERSGMGVREVDGPFNAVTDLTLVESAGRWGRYEAIPRTGQMHQIRAHAAALGIPIFADTLYGPGEGFPDWIALLAQSISFTDPIDGATITATSQRVLDMPGR